MKRRSSSSSAHGSKQRRDERNQIDSKLKTYKRRPSTSSTCSTTTSKNKLTTTTSTTVTAADDTEQQPDDSTSSCGNVTAISSKKSPSNSESTKQSKVNRSWESCNNIEEGHHDDGYEWNHLPHAVLARMFMFLDPADRRRASTTCKQWRECYYYPNLWRDVQLCFNKKWGWNGAEMVANRCGKYVHNLSIFPIAHTKNFNIIDCIMDFEKHQAITSSMPADPRYKSIPSGPLKSAVLLEKLKDDCKNLKTFHLTWIREGLPTFVDKNHPDPQDLIWNHLTALLDGADSMQDLTLGYHVNMFDRPGRLDTLAKLCGNTLRSLCCAVLTFRELFSEFEPSVPPNMKPFNSFRQLTDLSLNLVHVTVDLLGILAERECAMKTLGILATSTEDLDGTREVGASNMAWEKLVAHSPQLGVNVSFCGLNQTSILPNLVSLLRKQAMPLQQLKLVFGVVDSRWNMGSVFNLIQNNFSHVLNRLEFLIDNQTEEKLASLQPNPFILTLWKCRKITEMILKGYFIEADDLVGIARLRGISLRLLGVQGSYILYNPPWRNKKKLKEEISKRLGEDWRPMYEEEARVAFWGFMDQPPLPGNKYGSGPVI